MERLIKFAEVAADGGQTNVRAIKQSDIGKCPHYILVADHYRFDGTCRCDDPKNSEMIEWGYVWQNGRWE